MIKIENLGFFRGNFPNPEVADLAQPGSKLFDLNPSLLIRCFVRLNQAQDSQNNLGLWVVTKMGKNSYNDSSKSFIIEN